MRSPQEDGKVKILERIVPEATLPDQVDIALEGYAMWKQFEEGDEPFTFDVGLDLSTVASPRELGAHDLVFNTSDGDKTMGIQRFAGIRAGHRDGRAQRQRVDGRARRIRFFLRPARERAESSFA